MYVPPSMHYRNNCVEDEDIEDSGISHPAPIRRKRTRQSKTMSLQLPQQQPHSKHKHSVGHMNSLFNDTHFQNSREKTINESHNFGSFASLSIEEHKKHLHAKKTACFCTIL